MLKKKYKILPFFIIRFLAKRYCQKVQRGGHTYYTAFNDCLVKDTSREKAFYKNFTKDFIPFYD